jgi:hypothetical protein
MNFLAPSVNRRSGLREASYMRTCRLCLKDDVPDNAKRCPHCGAWQSKWRVIAVFRGVAEIVGWVFLTIFIVGLAACGAMGVLG